jgi:hypothetical protein
LTWLQTTEDYIGPDAPVSLFTCAAGAAVSREIDCEFVVRGVPRVRLVHAETLQKLWAVRQKNIDYFLFDWRNLR